MNPAALLVLVALGVWLVQTSAQRRRAALRRNPYNPRRRRPADSRQLAFPERSATDEYRERQAALRAEIERLRDETPNLRDFGLDRRDDFERALEAHDRRLHALQNERQRLGYEYRGLPVPERYRNPRRRNPTPKPAPRGAPVVLSLFPGADLLGEAFKRAGFIVVQGPELQRGGDVKDFHVKPGVFDGVIGGPPCQAFSVANYHRTRGVATKAANLVPEFVRIVKEAQPGFVVMENVPAAASRVRVPKAWRRTNVRDWDVGGKTARLRSFWTWPFDLPEPPRRNGRGSYSVTASDYRRGTTATQRRHIAEDRPMAGRLPGDLPLERYANLQGYPEVGRRIEQAYRHLPDKAKRAIVITQLGNGVPRAMGDYVANAAKRQVRRNPRQQGPSLSVVASTWGAGDEAMQRRRLARRKAGGPGFRLLPGNLPLRRYAELQGYPELGARLEQKWSGLPRRDRRAVVITQLGNGVPRAMGEYVASAARRSTMRNPRTCRCGSGAPCANPYTQACALPGGHVYDFAAGGRCQCCGRMAPKRTVELESRSGEHARYGRTCAARSIGTGKLRTNQLEHMDREAAEREAREAHYRGAGGRSGIVRPTFARGWSESDIVALAQQVGESPFDPGWWLSGRANLVPGRYLLTPQGRKFVPPTGEYRRFVLEGNWRRQRRGQRGGGAARSARPSRARAAAPSARYDDLPF